MPDNIQNTQGIVMALGKIRDEILGLVNEAKEFGDPIDVHAISLIAKKVDAQAELLALELDFKPLAA